MAGRFRTLLLEKGLKITPQRMAILEAVYTLPNHPTVEQIIELIRQHHSHIATGTVYKVLDTLIEKGLVKKVKTDMDILRYEAGSKTHHHLYSTDSDRIEDFYDDELNLMLQQYFQKKKVPGFLIEEIRLQVMGRFQPIE